MIALGQLCLLGAFVGSGCAACAGFLGWKRGHRGLTRAGTLLAIGSVAALSGTLGVLGWALVARDFRLAYVAEYSSRSLSWYYSLSALCVGQAGSLLVWAWLVGVVALAYRFWPGRGAGTSRPLAFALMNGYLGFLVAVMVFAADPMQPSLGTRADGAGLGPLLQHPAMLLHPPIVFLAYALWTVPCGIVLAALVAGELEPRWMRDLRAWALLAWTTLGVGILLGAEWAYEELGWGGYWGWDPVENGSLVPWLTGTAFLHAAMAWQYRGVLKKTTLVLAAATFALCNFAAFLTRSGVFSSLHAFSQSPIGWMFLVLMAAVAVAAVVLVFVRRAALAPKAPIAGLGTREALIVLAGTALVLLATVTLLGTLAMPFSDALLGRKIVLGPEVYNRALIPIGLVLLAATAWAPLVRWGAAPSRGQKVLAGVSGAIGVGAAAAAWAVGVLHPLGLAVAALTGSAIAALAGALWLDALVRAGRRQYAGFLIHLGFFCLAVGVAGSSLGTERHEVTLAEGETMAWAGRSLSFAGLVQTDLPDKIVVEARLEVSGDAGAGYTLLPAQHFHRLQSEWTTEVAIHSTWKDDFYAILHDAGDRRKAHLTLIVNPMMRWLWLSGFVAVAGTVGVLWPTRSRAATRSAVPPPHRTAAARPHRQTAPKATHGR